MNIAALDKISLRINGNHYNDCTDKDMLETAEERIYDLEDQLAKARCALLVEKGLLEYYKTKDKS